VLADDFIDIFLGLAGVPDALGIDDDARSQLAAVEAARGIDARAFDALLLDALFHVVAQLLRALGGAGAARGGIRPPVGAAENVLLVKTHA